jgi:hypothetical protein
MANYREIASHQEMLGKATSKEAPPNKPSPGQSPKLNLGKGPYFNAHVPLGRGGPPPRIPDCPRHRSSGLVTFAASSLSPVPLYFYAAKLTRP